MLYIFVYCHYDSSYVLEDILATGGTVDSNSKRMSPEDIDARLHARNMREHEGDTKEQLQAEQGEQEGLEANDRPDEPPPLDRGHRG